MPTPPSLEVQIFIYTNLHSASGRLEKSHFGEEWVEKIESDVLPSGFNHLIAAIADPYLVKSWSGMSIEGLPDTRAQLRLIEEGVIPMPR